MLGFHFHFWCQFSTLNRTWNGFSIYCYTLIELYHNQIWEELWRIMRLVDFRTDFCMEYISESEHFCKSQSQGTNTLYQVIFHLKSSVNGFFYYYCYDFTQHEEKIKKFPMETCSILKSTVRLKGIAHPKNVFIYF